MSPRIHRSLFIFCVIAYARLSAISMVYNFRIAQITKQPIENTIKKAGERKHTTVALVFDQFRKKYNGTRQNFLGGFGSFIYDFDAYYVRADFAISHIHEISFTSSKTMSSKPLEQANEIAITQSTPTSPRTTFSGTETDDVLFTAGRNFVLTNKSDITLSGLLGVPTHTIFRLQHVDFGTGQVGAGLQLDGLYALNDAGAFLYGARYIHFIPRKASDSVGHKHIFTIGNIGDLLLAYKHNWDNNGIEFGYTARSRFGAHIAPKLDEIIRKTNYVRSNFYAVYKYRFKLGEVSNRLLFNISYGFDHKPKIYGSKYIVTLWASWNISF